MVTFSAVLAADIFRAAFFVVAGVYFGIAGTVMWHYFRRAPTSPLRRLHVVGVSAGTSLLVVGAVGSVYERLGEELTWYASPIGFAGIVCVTAALGLLSAEQRRYRRRGGLGENLGRRTTDRDPPLASRR